MGINTAIFGTVKVIVGLPLRLMYSVQEIEDYTRKTRGENGAEINTSSPDELPPPPVKI